MQEKNREKRILIGILAAMTLLCGGWTITAQSAAADANQAAEGLRAQVDTLNAQVDALAADNGPLQDQLDTLRDENKALKEQYAKLQNDYDWLHENNEENVNKLHTLSAQVDSLKTQLAAASTASSTSSGTSSSSPSSGSTPKQTASNTSSSRTVYITKTGDKYHASGCRYLKKSKIAIDLADAKAQGYTACSVCGG